MLNVGVADGASASRWLQHRHKIATSRYGTMPVEQLLARFSATHGGHEVHVLFQALALRKTEAVPVVKERLRKGSAFEKFMLAKFLHSCPWRETMPELLLVAGDRSVFWLPRPSALYALGALGDAAAGANVEQILRQPDRPKGVQLAAIAALAQMNHRKAADTIRRFCEQDDVHLRLFAARALAEFGEPPTSALVTTGLQHDDYVVRQEACELLSFLPDSARPLQRLAQTDPHQSVRDPATRSLLEQKLRGETAASKLAILREALPQAPPRLGAWIIRTALPRCGAEGELFVRELAERDDSVGERSRVYLVLMVGQ